MNNPREEMIKQYMNAWKSKSKDIIPKIFASSIIYTECYGPEYHGINSMEKWFEEWNKQGIVIAWDVQQFIHENSTTVVQWYFKYEYSHNKGEFDGVSIFVFDAQNKITSVKEYKSELPHYQPYLE